MKLQFKRDVEACHFAAGLDNCPTLTDDVFVLGARRIKRNAIQNQYQLLSQFSFLQRVIIIIIIRSKRK